MAKCPRVNIVASRRFLLTAPWCPILEPTMEVRSVGTFPVILLKTSDPSPPTPNKVEFGAKWVRMSAFLATTLLGGVGERRDEPKAEPKNCP